MSRSDLLAWKGTAAVDQPVGMMYDTSNADINRVGPDLIGPEVAPNPLYTTVVDLGGGAYRCSMPSGGTFNYARFGDLVSGKPGRRYTGSAEVRIISGPTSDFRVSIKDTQRIQVSVSSEWTRVYAPAIAQSTELYRFIDFNRSNVDCVYEVRDVVLTELLASPAQQPTTAARPYLRQTPSGRHYLEALTGTPNQSLPITFSESLGSACTVIYPSATGLVTLTNQTIGTTYDAVRLNAFNNGLFVINRALTASELALVQGYMQRYVPQLGANLWVDPVNLTTGTGSNATWDGTKYYVERSADSSITQRLQLDGLPVNRYLIEGDVGVHPNGAGVLVSSILNGGPVWSVTSTPGRVAYLQVPGASFNTLIVYPGVAGRAFTIENISVREIL